MTKIEWTEKTWNPVVGCSIVSPGCTNCYAMKMAHRLAAMGVPHYQGLTKVVNGNIVWTGKLALAPEHILLEPLRRKKPTRWFVNSMSDLFHEAVADAVIDRVFAVMALTPQHDYQVLTKRSARMRAYCADDPSVGRRIGLETCDASEHAPNAILLADPSHSPFAPPGNQVLLGQWPLPNVWLGVSCERQKEADERMQDLLATPAAVRFVSAEPLLGPVDFTRRQAHPAGDRLSSRTWLDDLDWMIVGGESGPGARPFDLAWARSIVDQCQSAGVPVFVKQVGAHPTNGEGERCGHIMHSKGADMAEWPEDLRVREMPAVPAPAMEPA